MTDDIRRFCKETYEAVYAREMEDGHGADKKETHAQKEAIKAAIMEAMRSFPATDTSELWRSIYEVHVHHKSGIDNAETIAKVISADQSWKKSSGHAFEEMIKFLANEALSGTGIEILLQRDLSIMLKEKTLANEPRDISWLKEKVKGNVFDLYAVCERKDEKKFCFGCIQSKTSIRDRVTRDREPSIQAMQSYFWSAIIVLDGDFLRNHKFVSMVNGGSSEFPENGWHGMYVFSDRHSQDRIYATDLELKTFRDHARKAALYWLSQRQWFDQTWRAEIEFVADE